MVDAALDPKRVENLGPAERVISAISQFTDHLVHNRPGIVVPNAKANIGVRWTQATWRLQEDGSKVVFSCVKTGAGKTVKVVETRVGVLSEDGKTVREGNKVVGEFRTPGLFPEVAVWMYQQVADVFKMDADFAAHWASWAFTQDRRDLKTILAAFMLTQNHAGEPVVDHGEVLFHDDDFRAVGEAMCLVRQKDADLSPKQVLLIGTILRLPEIHAINREMGFAKSARNPQIRRYKKAVRKWLRYRENNPKMLVGIAKGGMGGIVENMSKSVGYKPQSENFFRVLRWKQVQAKDGRRTIGLDLQFEEKESWDQFSEQEVCERIIADQPSWKVLVGQLPQGMGLTRAIVAAAVEAGCLSDKDLIILTPTLEELGMLAVEPVLSRYKQAMAKATDQRARNIARNVKTKEATDLLEEVADVATAKAIEKVTRDLRCYFFVDKSASMDAAMDAAKRSLTKFVGGFPLDRTHIAVFNSMGTEIKLAAARSAAVEHAFSKHRASGGTSYSEGVRALQHHKPQEGEDALFIFVGDEEGEDGRTLAQTIQQTGVNPVGFALMRFQGYSGQGRTVRDAAAILQIPCPLIEEALFDDPYAVTQTLTNLIASTPVGAAAKAVPVRRRETLVEQILKTPLLELPLAFQ